MRLIKRLETPLALRRCRSPKRRDRHHRRQPRMHRYRPRPGDRRISLVSARCTATNIRIGACEIASAHLGQINAAAANGSSTPG